MSNTHSTENAPVPMASIVLAAGMGTRMKSDLAKVLHPLAGRPMIRHLLDTVESLGVERTAVVIGPDMEDVAAAVAPHPTAVQPAPLGTGDAVRAALPLLQGVEGDVLVLFGADPLVTAETMRGLVEARRRAAAAVAVLGFRPPDPGAYGRLVTADDGTLTAIVEAADASPEQLDIGLCNSGIMAIDGTLLADLIGALGNDNAKGEYYLTDIVALAREKGLGCTMAEGPAAELLGVDSRADLARAEAAVQDQLRGRAMAGGATLIDPPSVWFSYDTQLGRDVTIGPNVVFGPGVSVADNVEIRAFSHLEGARIDSGAVVGPFARLRPGADIGPGARIGNFVEIKNATLEAGAKVNHLTYVGDARVGAGANIGAGTITCNYDGFTKSRTDIGAGAFIGSNTALVAPVTIGDGAVVGAGSTIAKDVAADALAVTRAQQKDIPAWGARRRARAKDKKGGG